MLSLSKADLEELIARVVRNEIEQVLSTADSRSAKEFLSAEEVCELYHISRSVLYKLTSSREIPSMKTGKRLLLAKADMDDYVRKHRRNSLDEIRANL